LNAKPIYYEKIKLIKKINHKNKRKPKGKKKKKKLNTTPIHFVDT
jgi:hypothetical protein